MSGYLQEITEKNGDIQTWQTPGRQRWWGLVAAIVPAGVLIHALRDINNVIVSEVIVAGFLLLGALMVATYTVRFSLDLSAGTYQFVKGFLPVFFWGDRGDAKDAFQCIAVRKDTFLDASRHENDPDAEDFDQYRVVMVWKNPRKEAMLIDTEPLNWEESRKALDFRARAQARAHELAPRLGLDVLDQTDSEARSEHAAVEMKEEASKAAEPTASG